MVWNFKQFANNRAMLDDAGNEMSYVELYTFGERFFTAIGERCLIFIMCTNRIGSVAGYTACLNNGIVPVLLNVSVDADLRNSLIEKYQPNYFWVPSESVDAFVDSTIVFEELGYVLLKSKYTETCELFSELGLLLTTSGSTGSPKFVRQSYSNIIANTKSIIEYLEIDSSERAITTLPMNYTYGLSIINTHLYAGAQLLLTDASLMQKEFWTFFKDAKATSFGGVPYTYEMLDRLRFFRMELPSLRYSTQAGGKLTPELHKKFAEYAVAKGTKFIVMYGQCEATARMAYLPAEKSLEKYGSMGVPIPGGSFKLIDVDGSEILESKTTGELVYEGTNVTLGYADCLEDLAKGDERYGVLYTGDMAQRDEDGFYFIVGRKKRFLKIYGNRVNLDEIDGLVKTNFNNIDFASAGVDDHMYLFVVDAELATQVKEFVVAKTGLNQAAFKTVVIDSIPKNDAGKTLYKELTKYYE